MNGDYKSIERELRICDSDYCYPQRSTGYVIKIQKMQKAPQKILEVKKLNHVILYQELGQFIEYEVIQNGKGLKIKQFMDNQYGKELRERCSNLRVGWFIESVDNTEITEFRLYQINQLWHDIDIHKGYEVVFSSPSQSVNSNFNANAMANIMKSNQNKPRKLNKASYVFISYLFTK